MPEQEVSNRLLTETAQNWAEYLAANTILENDYAYCTLNDVEFHNVYVYQTIWAEGSITSEGLITATNGFKQENFYFMEFNGIYMSMCSLHAKYVITDRTGVTSDHKIERLFEKAYRGFVFYIDDDGLAEQPATVLETYNGGGTASDTADTIYAQVNAWDEGRIFFVEFRKHYNPTTHAVTKYTATVTGRVKINEEPEESTVVGVRKIPASLLSATSERMASTSETKFFQDVIDKDIISYVDERNDKIYLYPTCKSCVDRKLYLTISSSEYIMGEEHPVINSLTQYSFYYDIVTKKVTVGVVEY